MSFNKISRARNLLNEALMSISFISLHPEKDREALVTIIEIYRLIEKAMVLCGGRRRPYNAASQQSHKQAMIAIPTGDAIRAALQEQLLELRDAEALGADVAKEIEAVVWLLELPDRLHRGELRADPDRLKCKWLN